MAKNSKFVEMMSSFLEAYEESQEKSKRSREDKADERQNKLEAAMDELIEACTERDLIAFDKAVTKMRKHLVKLSALERP